MQSENTKLGKSGFHSMSVPATLKVPFIGIGEIRKWRHSIQNLIADLYVPFLFFQCDHVLRCRLNQTIHDNYDASF